LPDHEIDDNSWLSGRAAQNVAGERESLAAAAVVNCAGLASDPIAALAGIDVAARGLRQRPCTGD